MRHRSGCLADSSAHSSRSQANAAASQSPDVYDFAAAQLCIPVNLVRRCDNDNIGFIYDALQRQERRIDHIRVGAENPGSLESKKFLKLVAKRVAWIVGFSLVCHAENTHGQSRE